ncbi:MAG: hypothetical protein HKN17_01750 [Rhodothermales bacterium]|nr:hypothetical protein [Rhodothermales bacterium]
MKITTHNNADTPGLVRFDADLDGERIELEFRSDDIELVARPEAAVAAFLLLAMSHGEDIEVDQPLDPRFVMNLESILDTYACWSPLMKRIRVRSDVSDARPVRTNHREQVTATFCSGGVDSAYTLVKQMDRIDRLVFIHGFDVPLANETGRRRASDGLHRLAAACGKELIEVETNLRDVIRLKRPTPRLGAWEFSHGSALAAIAHVISGTIDRIYVPATISYPRLNSWGSHPVLDPLWSSHDIDLIHDGCEAPRFEKCTLVAQHPEIVENIRVCWKADMGEYNCGECEKCVRTMVAFAALGALDGNGPFATALTPRLLRSTDLRRRGYEKYYWLAYPDLRRRRPDLARGLLYMLAASRVRRAARTFRNRLVHRTGRVE